MQIDILKKDQLGPEVTVRESVRTLHRDGYKVALMAKTLGLTQNILL
jgi:Cft2 family RNA processing exonuclease